MKQLYTFCLLLTLAACGGGGSGGSDQSFNPDGSGSACAFDLSDFANGSSVGSSDTYWECDTQYTSYSMILATNGSGLVDDGFDTYSITWTANGCGKFKVVTPYGTGTISGFDGSLDEGIISYVEKSDDTYNTTCVLYE